MVIAEFLEKERERMQITLERFCEGIYTPSMMMRIEREERSADSLYLERLLERLGIAVEAGENYLNPDEYERWEAGQLILKALEEGDERSAEERIEQYRGKNKNNIIGEQFCCVMEAELRKQQGAGREQIGNLYREAALLTIPAIEKKCVSELCLSAKELDIVLEYNRYHHPERLGEVCAKMLEMLERVPYEKLEKAKIYPKAALTFSQECAGEIEKSARYVDNAIEILRDCTKTFYLSELLEVQIVNLKRAGVELERKLHNKQSDLEEYYAVLGEIYKENGISTRTKSITYLYHQRETYCISDIIRIRRKMLGMERRELCEGVCSLKTLGRIERGETNPQMCVIKGLFKKLHLPTEVVRLNFLTDEREVHEFILKVDKQQGLLNFAKVEEMLIDADKYEGGIYIENRQKLERTWIMAELGLQRCTKTEAENELQRNLEYTIPYDCIWKAEECFLTREEELCLQNLAVVAEGEKSFQILEKLKSILESYQLSVEYNCIAMYEIVMSAYASKLGDIAEYEKSNKFSKEIQRKSLRYGRIYQLEANIYGILWNRLQSGAEVSESERERELRKCLMITRFNKKEEGERFFKEKLRGCKGTSSLSQLDVNNHHKA